MQRARPGAPASVAPPSGLVRPVGRLAVLIVALCSAAPRHLEARQGPTGSARAAVEASFGSTAIRGHRAMIGGGSGLLDVALPVRLGGAGWVALSSQSLPGGTDHYDLHFAYGGLLLEAPLARRARCTVAFRTLFGVGNAKVSLPVVSTLIGADNFGVVEPELHGSWRLHRGLSLTLGAGYRFVFGVEDLPGLTQEDLRGPSLRVGLSLSNF